MMRNLQIYNNTGESFYLPVSDDFTVESFVDKLKCKRNSDLGDCYLIVNGEYLPIENFEQSAKQLLLINKNPIIFIMHRIVGGEGKYSTFIEFMLKAIESKLPNEMKLLSYREQVCAICCENKSCLKLCCSALCQSCFLTNFKLNHFILRCLQAQCQINRLSYKEFFRTNEFIEILVDLERKRELLRYINVQFCTCGQMLISKTMLAQHTCSNCNRVFCFFCNKPWEASQGMKNDRNTCTKNCEYESKITFKLILMCAKYNPDLLLPDRRCCPKCFSLGAYGNGCKFHVCDMCKYTFCFICLESETRCRELFKTTRYDPYAQKCAEIKRVGYEIFPTYNQ